MRTLKIYCDCDNVITDFDRAVRELGDVPAEGLAENATEMQKQTMYKAIEDAGPRFWSEMEWLPEGKVFWRFLSQFDPVILTSPGEFSWAVAGRTNWMDKNLPGVSVFYEPDKFIYAERGALLIDDMKRNVGAWEMAGGIGVLFTDAVDTTNRLLDIIRGYSPSKSIYLSHTLRRIARKVLHSDPEENQKLLDVFQEDE